MGDSLSSSRIDALKCSLSQINQTNLEYC
jgi:hypothetical protein